jgi:hypothetical protein
VIFLNVAGYDGEWLRVSLSAHITKRQQNGDEAQDQGKTIAGGSIF